MAIKFGTVPHRFSFTENAAEEKNGRVRGLEAPSAAGRLSGSDDEGVATTHAHVGGVGLHRAQH